MMIPLLLAALLTVACTSPVPLEDEVTALPGWRKPLKSKMYSGYVSAGDDVQDGVKYVMHEHYIFIESENDPANDPVLIWTNGGPGAASYFGLFTEVGPYYVSGDSLKTDEFNATGVPTLFDNKYAWTQKANLLIINSPPPVGYSYCDNFGPAGNGSSCGKWNDERTAKHNYIYLSNWLEAFESYQHHDFYIVGESYGGIYVPTLVREILQHETSILKKQLKGFAIIDGCVGTDVLCNLNPNPEHPSGPGNYFHVLFFGGHHAISMKLYADIMEKCPKDQLLGYGTPLTDPVCKALIAKATYQIGGMYAYSLYDTCWYQNGLKSAPKKGSTRNYWGPPTREDVSRIGGPASEIGGAVNDYPCGGGGALFKWIEHPSVKRVLGVAPDALMFMGDNGAGLPYTLTEKNLLPFYEHVVLGTDLRVLIINGDTDPTLDSFVAQNWTTSLGFKEVEEWRPWTIDGKQWMGGSITRYEHDFDFVTVRGSGHMVPQYKPRVSYEWITNFLENKPYKKYDGPSAWPEA